MAKDGRVFYAGRAVCSQGQTQITNWATANVGLGCGTIHVWDPNTAGSGSQNQDPAKITKVDEFQVFGAKGGGGETGATSKDEQGVLGIALDPDFTNGRPYIYVQYHPYFSGEKGYPPGTVNQYVNGNNTSYGPGLVRTDYRAERRLSRFTYDNATKTIVPGSEKVILHWMTQVFSCCHLGGSMDFDSKGNLYMATGDNTGNSPNSNNSRLHELVAAVHDPLPRQRDQRLRGHRLRHRHVRPGRRRTAPATCAMYGYRPGEPAQLRLHELRRRPPDVR